MENGFLAMVRMQASFFRTHPPLGTAQESSRFDNVAVALRGDIIADESAG